ncbi:MAG: hypothetical protein PHE79_09465 [Eubacteriales bacterium]|nr:hypothetical protein [Eubacteriales bacterium]
MRSKASYFSISKPMIIENLRRFWAIPALAFLVYFLSGVFPILMTYSHLNPLSGYIGMSLSNQQPFYMFAHLIFPIAAAVVIFRYLHGVSSVSVVHSMPFTRAKLYNSGFISGLIMIAAPIIVNGLILLAISKPVYNEYHTETGLMLDTVNVFSRADVLNWIWVSLLIAFVIYAVSVFTGMLTGNSLMHFALAAWFNFLLPMLYFVFVAYFSHYLYGFDTSANLSEFGLRISPFLNILRSEGVFDTATTVYYIVSFFILLGITGFLYQKRRLERASDSLVFGFMEPIICYLITFFGMTMLGFYFDVLGESEWYIYAGFAAGTVIFFIIGQMIVKKTPRVYNLESLKSLVIYGLIAVLFILGLKFDVTGFEKRVPDPANVRSITIESYFDQANNFNFFNNNYLIRHPIYKSSDEEGEFRMKDPENIKAVTKLHRSLTENKERLINLQDIYASNVLLTYDPDSTFPMSRRYQIDYNSYRNSPEFKQIYESKEFKEFFAPGNLNYETLTQIYINSEIPSETVEIKNQAEMQEFMDCLDRDFKAQTFEDMTSLKHKYATVDIDFKYKNKNSDTPEKLLETVVSYTVTDNYKNTIQWLEEHGYKNRFIHNVSDVEYIELFHNVHKDYKNDLYPGTIPNVTSESETVEVKSLKITDPVKIQELLNSYESMNINYNDYYSGVIEYRWNSDYQQQYIDDDYMYERSFKEDYGREDMPSMTQKQIYFNEGNVPDYVLEYFKK